MAIKFLNDKSYELPNDGSLNNPKSAKIVKVAHQLSDGLSSSLYQLQEINNVGFEINQKKIPVASELLSLKKKIKTLDVEQIALHFGGDYELLVTIPQDVFEKTQKIIKKQGVHLHPIGSVKRTKKIMLNDGKRQTVLDNKGYEHFKKHVF